MTNICGEVDFTSLEFIVAPLRAMVKSDKNARTYISNSISGQPLLHRFQQDQAVQDMVRKFIESLSRNAKNSNTFKETVKTFWQSCKQLQMQLQPQTIHGGGSFAHGSS